VDLSEFVARETTGFSAAAGVWSALRTRGKILGEGAGFSWGLLPLVICQSVRGEFRRALPLSTAVECFMAAADTLDDVQDGDSPTALWRTCGAATATNIATFLLFLTQLSLTRLAASGLPDRDVVEVVRSFAFAGARACGGQQMDLDHGSDEDLDESRSLETSGHKSASLVECVCRSAAIAASAMPADIDICARFGYNVGMALQIRNDVLGVSTEGPDRNDLRFRKRTLPLIFALDRAPDPIRRDLSSIFWPGRTSELGDAEIELVHRHLRSSGALLYADAVAGVYWERALDCLDDLKGANAGMITEWITPLYQS
jgi:octaprenyl-diphosphate synthase